MRTGRGRGTAATSSGGREELRSTLLKPYLLRLRDARGEPATRALLATAGLSPAVLDDETAWISSAAARRALDALVVALGHDAIEHPGAWAMHPEALGAWVTLLRIAATPLDAYRYLAAHAAELTRIGTLTLAEQTPGRATITYEPRAELEVEQEDALLCAVRRAQLATVPCLWGLAEAEVREATCLSRGDDRCSYEVRWMAPSNAMWPGLGALAGAAASGGAVALSGNALAAGIAALIGAAFGAAVGQLRRRMVDERAQRALEKHRILALERGLDLRGQSQRMAGDLTGTVLGGKYRILRRIGSGGIGAVYAAEHVALGSLVAVKVLRGAAAADASEIARLRREARVQVSIEHPNVVRTLDLDQLPDGSLYVVMELLRGQSLGERLRSTGPIAAREAVPIFLQVCRALDAAHRAGVVHRDLKPANVFLCDDGSVKVLDFGMSKLAEAETLTQAGYTLGTPEYMSPEQCVGAPVEPRSDLYTFGVLMYEALTGTLPIRGRSRRELLDLHQTQIPEPLFVRAPTRGIPRALDAAVLRCLAKRAAERPLSASALEALLTGEEG